jgi:hypothetical protein
MTSAFRVHRRAYLMDGPGKRPTPRRSPRNGQIQVSRFHPAAYETAMVMAGYDRRRIHIVRDGSGAIIVSNDQRRPKWMSP